MKIRRSSSLRGLQVVGRLEELRAVLLRPEYAEHQRIPLAHWALPTDRWLPLAFLGHSLNELLQMPVVELIETPGVGQKKLKLLAELFSRAINTRRDELPKVLVYRADGADIAGGNGDSPHPPDFDPDTVSEVVWSTWRADVVKHGLCRESLGRLAPSLQRLTRAIWNTRMSDYVDCTLSEISQLKTHGEKRLHSILEVFHCVHQAVSSVKPHKHLAIRIVPRWIEHAEQWANNLLLSPGLPETDDIRENFIEPLLEQIRIDANVQIAGLAECRLGFRGPITSIRQLARSMNLTRARVYQLLNEIIDIMQVRWPQGRRYMYDLRDIFQPAISESTNPPDLTQFLAAMELFYPGNRRCLAGPIVEMHNEPHAVVVESVLTALLE
jgi:hypothetical protein